MAIILGLDPGSQRAGFAVIDKQPNKLQSIESGTVVIDKSLSWEKKLLFISNSLDEVFLRHRPEEFVIEKAFFGKNAESAFKLGQVRGVLLLLAGKYHCKVFEYAAKKIKKSVTGHGGATKEHVQLIVSRLLNINEFSSFDESDAMATALCRCFDSQSQLKVMNQPEVLI